MKLKEVMSELAAKGSEATKRLWLKHRAKEPFFGVKIADLKVIAKKLKGEQALALELYATGDRDAQYLAGIARKIGKEEVDVGDTDCKIPEAESYIMKSRRGAPIAPKRKTARC